MHPTIIPPDFITRHNLVHRLYLAPLRGLTPRAPWAPLTVSAAKRPFFLTERDI